MKSLRGFQELNEKVSKKEINEGLKDPNLQIGIEYEFIFHPSAFLDDDIVKVSDQYEKLWYDVRGAMTKAKKLKEQHENRITANLAITKGNYQHQIMMLQKESLPLDPDDPRKEELINKMIDLAGIVSEIEELETLYVDDVMDADTDHIEWELDFPKPYEWERKVEVPDIDSSEYNEYLWWLENTKGVVIDSRDWNLSAKDTIINAVNNGTLGGMDDLFNEFEMEEPDGDMSDVIDYPNGYEWEKRFDMFFNDDKYLPFNTETDAEYYGVDAHRTKFKKWGVGSDSSLTPLGCEITSPVSPVAKGALDLIKMFEFIRKYGYTDNSCGLHVNMSYKNKKFDKFDPLKVMLFMDEGIIDKWFKDRVGNTYAQSVLEFIRNSATGMGKRLNAPQLGYKEIFTDFKNSLSLPQDKYYGVNIENTMIGSASDRVEFRYLGGDNYEKKTQQVLAQIGRYAYYMRLGFDPSFKKKEYDKKVVRLYEKYYTNKPEDLSKVSDSMAKLILKRGEFAGTDDDGFQVYVFKGKTYHFWIDGSDYDIITVMSLSEAKRKRPFSNKVYKWVKDYGKEYHNMTIVLSKYQSVKMPVYSVASGSKLFITNDNLKSVGEIQANNYKIKGNTVYIK